MTNERPDLALFMPSLGGGGAERVMVDLAREAANRGLSVDLVVVSTMRSDVEVPASGVRVVDLGHSRALTAFPALVRYLRRERPPALLSTLDHTNVAAVLAARLVGGVRVVVRQANAIGQQLAPNAVTDRVLRTLMHWSYRRADGVVAVSHGVADELLAKLTLPAARVRVVANPVLTPRVFEGAQEAPSHPWFDDPTVPVVLSVGRLVPEKGYETLVRAVATANRTRPYRLVILGEGPLRPQLTALADSLGLADRFELPGFAPNPFAHMARCGAFVLSSRTEGLPNALIQALAVGARVVATDCPSGPREVLDNGTWGELVPVDDEAAMSAAIMRVLETPARRPPAAWFRRYDLAAVADTYLSLLGVSPARVRAAPP